MNQHRGGRLSFEAQHVVFKMSAGDTRIIESIRPDDAHDEFLKIQPGPLPRGLRFNNLCIGIKLLGVPRNMFAQAPQAANILSDINQMIACPTVGNNAKGVCAATSLHVMNTCEQRGGTLTLVYRRVRRGLTRRLWHTDNESRMAVRVSLVLQLARGNKGAGVFFIRVFLSICSGGYAENKSQSGKDSHRSPPRIKAPQ